MPQNRSNSSRRARSSGADTKPPEVMTWGKAIPVLVVCGLFDFLRLMFEQFLFFGPAFANIYCVEKVSNVVGTTIGGVVCSSTAIAAGLLSGVAIETFGIMMAMAIGLIGWLSIGAWLMGANRRILKENEGNAVWFVASLAVSEIPIVGSLPALTAIMARMYYVQIKKEEAALKKYEEEQAARRLRERAENDAEFMQARGEQFVSELEAADDEQSAEVEAVSDEEYETPEQVRKRA